MTVFSRPTGSIHKPGHQLRRTLKVASICALSLIIVACGADTGTTDENRQFANQAVTRTPQEKSTVTPTTVINVDATPDVPETTSASPEVLLRSRGAPNTLYTEDDGSLQSITVHGETVVSTPIDFQDGWRLLGFDSSPTGDQVAALLAGEQGDLVLRFFDRDGQPVGEPVNVLRSDMATPATPAVASPRYLVDWSPQGTDVLVSNGLLLESVSTGGSIESISLDDFEGHLLSVGRSPQGTRVLLHFQYDDETEHVFVRDLESGKTRELRALATTADGGLTNLQWLPNGVGVAYVRGTLSRGVVMHGQVFVYRLGQERAQPVATPGRGGPSATITDAVVSPDGGSVAYVISLLDGSRWSFHSMWVRSLDGSQSYQVPVVPRGVVGHVAWLNGGIAWEQRRESSAPGQVLFIEQEGRPDVVLNKARTSIGATPVASPGASPVASPVSTPDGTPAADPMATPVGMP